MIDPAQFVSVIDQMKQQGKYPRVERRGRMATRQEAELKRDPRGIGTVRVNKDEVIKKMKENRDKHHSIFLEALEGYHKEFVKRLESTLEDAKKKKKFTHFWSINQPEDHTDEYDGIIEMLEMSLDGEVVLTQAEFRMYMMDDWGWKNNFLQTNSVYSASATREIGN